MAVPLLRAVDQAGRLVAIVRSSPEAELVEKVGLRHLDGVVELAGESALAVSNGLRALAKVRSFAPTHYLASHGLPTTSQGAFALAAAPNAVRVGPTGLKWPFYHRSVEAKYGEHKSDYYLAFAREAGMKVQMKPSGYLAVDLQAATAAEEVFPRLPGESLVIFAPGSGESERHKRWPLERFVQLAKRLQSDIPSIRIAATGASSEAALLHELRELAAQSGCRIEIVPPLPLQPMLEVFRRAEVVVSPCNGASHMAAAAGVPVVGLYGPTNPGFTGPNTTKLWAITTDLSCSPCYRASFVHGCATPICMSRISATSVASAVVSIVNRASFPPRPWRPTTNARAAAIPPDKMDGEG